MTSICILVVDDEQLVRWSLRERLLQAGYRVVEAATGKEALDRMNVEVDLVLLDLRLPDLDGLTVLRHIRSRGSRRPVIVMTAYGNPDIVREALGCGACQVVDKPFSLDRILTLVERALHPGPPPLPV